MHRFLEDVTSVNLNQLLSSKEMFSANSYRTLKQLVEDIGSLRPFLVRRDLQGHQDIPQFLAFHGAQDLPERDNGLPLRKVKKKNIYIYIYIFIKPQTFLLSCATPRENSGS